MPEVNEAVIATYLAGGNTRRIRGALQPLLKAAPLSKSAVSRVIATLKGGLEAWRTRSLTDLGHWCSPLSMATLGCGARADHVAQDRRLAEDRRRAQPAHSVRGMTHRKRSDQAIE